MNNYSVKALKVKTNITNMLKKFCEFPPSVFFVPLVYAATKDACEIDPRLLYVGAISTIFFVEIKNYFRKS